MVRKARKFNWQGITENFDGSFTTTGKREKRRVLKALHEQGVAVRSKKNADGSWTVTPVGTVRVKAQPRTQSVPMGARPRELGHRPNTRESGFPTYPKRGSRPIPGRRAYPTTSGGPVYRGAPRASGPSAIGSFSKKAGEFMRERAARKKEQEKKEQEFKKASEEDKARYAEHIKEEQKEDARRQMEKDRLRRESYGQQPGDLKTSLHNADVKAEQRRTDDAIKRQQEQRQQRQDAKHNQGGWTGGSTRAPEIPKQKVDAATLHHAREQAVKGED